jgi:hypothetical protein
MVRFVVYRECHIRGQGEMNNGLTNALFGFAKGLPRGNGQSIKALTEGRSRQCRVKTDPSEFAILHQSGFAFRVTIIFIE